jgi:hypothetical protein
LSVGYGLLNVSRKLWSVDQLLGVSQRLLNVGQLLSVGQLLGVGFGLLSVGHRLLSADHRLLGVGCIAERVLLHGDMLSTDIPSKDMLSVGHQPIRESSEECTRQAK